MNEIRLILKQHLEYIKKYNYQNVVDSIIGDMLMNKVKLVDKKIKVNINGVILKLIQDWYSLATNLNKIKKLNNSKYITVYRGVYDMIEEENTILQPIPFSTSLLISSCYNWIENRDNSFIMKINLPVRNLFTFIGNENEGYEIILSSGFLKKKEKVESYYKNKKIIEYDFESICFLEMENIINKLNS